MTVAQWTLRAQADLAAIDDFYADIDRRHADRVGSAAIAAGDFLADYPNAGPVVARQVRKWSVRDTDYLLFYRPTGNGVQILRVRHGRENWRGQR